MSTRGAIGSSFFVLVTICGGVAALAESPASKPATKPASSADPFEDTTAPAKPRPAAPPARPAASAAARPEAAKPEAAPSKPASVPPPAPEGPSKELEAFMRPFEGSWKCETTFPAGSLGPGSQPPSAKTEVTIKKQFGGYGWHGEFKLGKTALTAATTGVFQIGYAASAKQATFLSYDSVGSSMMGAGTLAGDSVTFVEEGYLKGARVKVRETLALRGPRQMHHKLELEQGKSYQTLAEDSCVK